MKKLMIMLMICAVVLAGCGHKSNVECTDIEQFRCQDSIQTVFDILGESNILHSKYSDGEYYEYENLNLWGYNGEAIFNVRDDKDTIQSFYCNLQLSKKEFQDVLFQFKSKYGEYEKNEYPSQTAYIWEIPEDELEKTGYSRISLTDCGDRKAIVDFSDEWSIKTDEVYYKYLEEKEQVNILAQKTYSIGDDTFDFSFVQKENKDYSITLICNIEDKSDAFMTHISLNALFNNNDESIKVLTENTNFTYSIIIGDGTVLLRTKEILYLMKDEEVVDVDDYFSIDWFSSEEYQDSDYGTQVSNFLVDFIEENN